MSIYRVLVSGSGYLTNEKKIGTLHSGRLVPKMRFESIVQINAFSNSGNQTGWNLKSQGEGVARESHRTILIAPPVRQRRSPVQRSNQYADIGKESLELDISSSIFDHYMNLDFSKQILSKCFTRQQRSSKHLINNHKILIVARILRVPKMETETSIPRKRKSSPVP